MKKVKNNLSGRPVIYVAPQLKVKDLNSRLVICTSAETGTTETEEVDFDDIEG